MTKRSVIQCILAILLTAYLAVALVYTHAQAKTDTLKGLDIVIEKTSASGFVRPADIDHELGSLSKSVRSIQRSKINTLDIERQILGMDKIEQANCLVLNNGVLQLQVKPLEPVARVFDFTAGNNYYINRQGKRMRASNRYRMDVPVISGHFPEGRHATCVLPVIDYLATDSAMQSLCTSFRVERNGDIMIMPRILGHVINFGDSADVANKFARLRDFYQQVMPVKGWEYYDTISLKWRGQVVAKRHEKKRKAAEDPLFDEAYIDDAGTMAGASDSITSKPIP